MNFALFRHLILVLWLMTAACTEVTNQKPTQLNYTGACTEEFTRAYENLLNWSEDTAIKTVCDDFYSIHANTKCVSKIDGIELRLRTTDFDKKCNRGIASNKNKKASEPAPLGADSSAAKAMACSSELTKFIIEKQSEFHKQINEITTAGYSSDSIFEVSLSSKRICNQYFFGHKYMECPADGLNYSFWNLKPYCDQFQSLLHGLRVKNPKKYYPEELKPITDFNLKLVFKNPLTPFYKSRIQVKDSYFAEGNLVSFSQIPTGQTYCFLESETLRLAGELKNEFYKVDIAFLKKNRVAFSYNSFNENWRLVCVGKNYLYLQDILETLGEKILILN